MNKCRDEFISRARAITDGGRGAGRDYKSASIHKRLLSICKKPVWKSFIRQCSAVFRAAQSRLNMVLEPPGAIFSADQIERENRTRHHDDPADQFRRDMIE